MKIRFTHLTGSMRGAIEEFSLPIIKVGRALSSDLLLQDEEGMHRLASRLHAEFRMEGDQFILQDMSSRNGTFVNGQPVDYHILIDGDQVSFGLNGISFQVNFIDTPEEEIDFLRGTPLFKDLSAELLHRVYKRGYIESFSTGSVLFKIGQSSSNLYIVRNGIIELRSPKEEDSSQTITNYIGPGQTLGETTALLNEAHTSEARVPEGAEIFIISAERLRELIRSNPDIAEHFVLTFARYLSSSYKRLSMQNKSKLQGSLFYFDLATVLQTLINSNESGLLTIYSIGRGLVRSMAWSSSIGAYPLGQVYLENGMVVSAWASSLYGEEAFFQLFQAELNGSFSFEQEAKMSDRHPGEMITKPPRSLVFESVKLQDELNQLRDKYPDDTMLFQLNGMTLHVEKQINEPIADIIYRMLIERPFTLIEFLDTLPCCYYRTYAVLDELYSTHQITIAYPM